MGGGDTCREQGGVLISYIHGAVSTRAQTGVKGRGLGMVPAQGHSLSFFKIVMPCSMQSILHEYQIFQNLTFKYHLSGAPEMNVTDVTQCVDSVSLTATK